MARQIASVLPVSVHWLLFSMESEEGAERPNEIGPRYHTGRPKATMEDRIERIPVVKTQIAKRGLCRGEVESGAQVCRWCGTWLLWPGDDDSSPA